MTNIAAALRARFGEIDVYLFDQLQRGRLARGMGVLDAGCGQGRNLVFLLHEAFDVRAVDTSAEAIDAVRLMAERLLPGIDPERFQIEPVERMSLGDASVDYVISSAVLHFARDRAHWQAMVDEMWRVLAPGGVLFARLATTIGQEGKLKPVGTGGRYLLPDGSVWFLVDEPMLAECTDRLGAIWLDPLKTSVVHNTRSMATWVIGKPTTREA